MMVALNLFSLSLEAFFRIVDTALGPFTSFFITSPPVPFMGNLCPVADSLSGFGFRKLFTDSGHQDGTSNSMVERI